MAIMGLFIFISVVLVILFLAVKVVVLSSLLMIAGMVYLIGIMSMVATSAFWLGGIWLFGQDNIVPVTFATMIFGVWVFIASLKISYANIRSKYAQHTQKPRS